MMDIKDALEALKVAGPRLGTAWERAHRLAQSHQGIPAYDRLHALVHRIEGDLSNAAYWYRRTGEDLFEGSVDTECDLLLERLTKT